MVDATWALHALAFIDRDGFEVRRAFELRHQLAALGTLVAVDHAKRLLTLRREDGGLLEVEVGEAARNFDQIAVGDTVRVRYEETLTAEKLPPGEALRPAEGAVTAALAQAGTKPGGGVGIALSVPVKIESIDLPRSIVVFSLSSGELIARRVETPEGRAFLQGLAIGDTVRLDYTEALALGIEEL